MKKIDTAGLRDLFQRQIAKTHADPHCIERFIDVNSFKITQNDASFLGRYNPETHEIWLCPKRITNRARLAVSTYFDAIYSSRPSSAEVPSSIANHITPYTRAFYKEAILLTLSLIPRLRHDIDEMKTGVTLEKNRTTIINTLTTMYTNVQTLSTTIHEQLHALTNPNSASGSEQSDNIKSGFEYWEKIASQAEDGSTNIGTVISYRAFNEGVTQLITRRLTKAYLHEHPQPGLSKDEQRIFIDHFTSYPREQWVVEQYITIIAVLADIPEEVVQNSIVDSYFTNGHAVPETFADLLHENGVTPKLAEALTLFFDIAIQEDLAASESSSLYESMNSIIDNVPPAKQDLIRKRFAELFEIYSQHRSFYSS